MNAGSLAANAAWLTLAAIAHNLTRAAGCLASRFHAKARTGTLRHQLITLPTRISDDPAASSCGYTVEIYSPECRRFRVLAVVRGGDALLRRTAGRRVPRPPPVVWAGLDIGRRRAVLDCLMTVTVLPIVRPGPGFDPATVRIEPKQQLA